LEIEKNAQDNPDLCHGLIEQFPPALARVENTIANIHWTDQTGSQP